MIVISGPSGIGKSTLITKLRCENQIEFIVPTTTRPLRVGEEVHGRDYNFVDTTSFHSRIRANAFEDWDHVLGNYYGFERDAPFDDDGATITHALARMAIRLRARHPRVTLVFLRPANEAAHIDRLTARFDDRVMREARLQHWWAELAHAPLFDHVLSVSGACDAVGPAYHDFWKGLGLRTPAATE